MTTHRIRELRERRSLSQEKLGERIGRSKSVISRLEDGTTSLDIDIARKIATALDTTLSELLGIEAAEGRPIAGLDEELLAYTVTAGDGFSAMTGPNRYPFEVRTHAVDKSGIHWGDIVVIDNSAEACKAPRALQAVRVRFHPAEDFMQPVSLLRLFVPPSLLITNSSRGNLMSLDCDAEYAHIVGVVVDLRRRFI